jgi:hypothetical protein
MNKQHPEQEVVRREARSTLLDPITPENAVLLLVDQQEGLFSRIYEPEQTRRQLLGLARATQLLGVPAVLTTALATGPNGPMLHALTTIFDGAESSTARSSTPGRTRGSTRPSCAPGARR